MLRFALSVLAFVCCVPAFAADGAQSRALGYSTDARYFAFEEYGIQDGSGAAYSSIFILDTEKDDWVKGTPIRVQGTEDEGDVAVIRDRAMKQAAPLIADLKLTGAFDTLVHMPFTEIVPDRTSVRFARSYASSGRLEDYDSLGSFQLRVASVAVPQPAGCPDADFITVTGMEVSLTNLQSGARKILASDKAIPKSRWCPHDYDIEAVYAPTAMGLQKDPLVALIGVYSRGFEGSDRHFIAVPFELNH